MMLLSYDVSATRRSAASRVAHSISVARMRPNEGRSPYVHRAGVVWIGQSVFLMPKYIATERAEKLHTLGALVTIGHVSIPVAEIEALRRRTRSHGAS